MRAFAADRFGAIENLTLRDLPKPVAGPGELLVKVRAAAVNPADLKVLFHRDGGSFLHASKFPLLLGYDFSGTVEALGAGASGRAVGEDVFGFLPYGRGNASGSFAEYLTCKADSVGPKPKSISHEEAASSATAAITALQALRGKGRLTDGQSVLINGASGGVGTYAVQMAKALGVTAIATASAAKADAVKALGAAKVYDYKTTPMSQIAERFEVVLDVVANSSYGACAHLLKPGGAFVTLVPGPAIFAGKLQALFSSKRASFVICKSLPDDLAQIAKWFDDGSVKPMLDRAYPLAELPLALARQQSGEVRGKLAITVSAS